MNIDLTGLLDDASPLGAGVQWNPRRPIRFTQGASVRLRLTVIRRDGTAVNLALDPSTVLEFNVKKTSLDDKISTLSKTGVLVPTEANNRADFTIAPTDTKFVQPGRYIYDVWLTYLGERNPVVPASLCAIEPTITAIS